MPRKKGHKQGSVTKKKLVHSKLRHIDSQYFDNIFSSRINTFAPREISHPDEPVFASRVSDATFTTLDLPIRQQGVLNATSENLPMIDIQSSLGNMSSAQSGRKNRTSSFNSMTSCVSGETAISSSSSSDNSTMLDPSLCYTGPPSPQYGAPNPPGTIDDMHDVSPALPRRKIGTSSFHSATSHGSSSPSSSNSMYLLYSPSHNAFPTGHAAWSPNDAVQNYGQGRQDPVSYPHDISTIHTASHREDPNFLYPSASSPSIIRTTSRGEYRQAQGYSHDYSQITVISPMGVPNHGTLDHSAQYPASANHDPGFGGDPSSFPQGFYTPELNVDLQNLMSFNLQAGESLDSYNPTSFQSSPSSAEFYAQERRQGSGF